MEFHTKNWGLTTQSQNLLSRSQQLGASIQMHRRFSVTKYALPLHCYRCNDEVGFQRDLCVSEISASSMHELQFGVPGTLFSQTQGSDTYGGRKLPINLYNIKFWYSTSEKLKLKNIEIRHVDTTLHGKHRHLILAFTVNVQLSTMGTLKWLLSFWVDWPVCTSRSWPAVVMHTHQFGRVK